jgi:uncharacterized protein YlxP (DUF503 family)
MAVGLLILELHLPDVHSLKEKRLVIRRLQDRLRARFNVAVAELEHQDLWQRSVIGVVTVSSAPGILEQMLQGVERESESLLGRDLVRTEIALM